MAQLRGPAVPRRRLGAELRRLREGAGCSLEQAAAHLECSTSKISRLETGKGVPRIRDVRDLVDLYGLRDQRLRDRMARWVREGQQQGWWHDYTDVIGDKWDTFMALEADAAAMYSYETAVVHGLLQTADYARAIGRAVLSDPTDGELDRFVQVRLLRQRVLDGDGGDDGDGSGLRLHVIVEETAVYRPVGGLEVFRGQLAHLLDMADHPAVRLQVLPLTMGAHAAMGIAFALMTFEGEDTHDVVYVEGIGGAVVIEHERGVAPYRQAFTLIESMALGRRESVDFIAAILQGSD
jgi:hypothetical protein